MGNIFANETASGRQAQRTANRNRGASRLTALVAIIVVLVVIAGGIWFAAANRTTDNSAKAVNTKEYQALFLTNGQVYFGKLSNVDDKYVTLTDIYYLQVQQSASSSTQNLQQTGGSDVSSDSKVSLAKLGGELHGPEDKMEVASGQVLFWENLKPSSKVVQAITTYQNK